MKENIKKLFTVIVIFSLSVPIFSRAAVNIAPISVTSEDFFLEKQKHDGALSKYIEFYPLDTWYFSNLMKTNKDLFLNNTYEPGTRDLYGTPESSFLWYQDIADGLYNEYKQFEPYAQYIVAKCYLTQNGIIKSYDKAREYAKKAFDRGFAGSYLIYAQAIEEGFADKTISKYNPLDLIKKSCDQDFPEAYVRLAQLSSGNERREYLNKAINYNYAEAYFLSAQDILNIDDIPEEELTNAVIEERMGTASVLLEEAEKLFHAKSAMLIGDFYANKICYETEYSTILCKSDASPFHNQEKAISSYMNAVMFGEPRGFAALAAIYREGLFEVTDKNSASFYYYKYRDALYDERIEEEARKESMRSFYEDEGNEPDETVCYELGLFYLNNEHPDRTRTALEWLQTGAEKGSANCMKTLAELHKGNKESLKYYKDALNESRFPLFNKKDEISSALDDIYAQAIHASRFKNDVEYWEAMKAGKLNFEKKETPKNTEMLSICPSQEAVEWFRKRSEERNIFLKTWYAWILIDDMDSGNYEIKNVSTKSEKYLKDAWSVINDVLEIDPAYAPALVLKGRALANGYGTKKKPREVRELYEKASEYNYSEAWGFLYDVANDKMEMEKFVTNGCKALDEKSFYHAFSMLLWLEGQSDVTESIKNSVKYGYIPSYTKLIDQNIADMSVTFDNDYTKIDDAYETALYLEQISSNSSKTKSKRQYIESNYADNMTRSSYGVQNIIDYAKKKVSANTDDMEALYNLALAYEDAAEYNGSYLEMAAKYYLMSAKLGYMEAMEKIANCYFYGKGVEINYSNAYLWYNAALLSGSQRVNDIVGTMLIEGLGCTRDLEKGINFYKTECIINEESPVRRIMNCFNGIPEFK